MMKTWLIQRAVRGGLLDHLARARPCAGCPSSATRPWTHVSARHLRRRRFAVGHNLEADIETVLARHG
jgi:hypothetical protein